MTYVTGRYVLADAPHPLPASRPACHGQCSVGAAVICAVCTPPSTRPLCYICKVVFWEAFFPFPAQTGA